VKIDVVPLTQEQIISDPRYYLRDFFTLYVDQPRFKYYICTQCKGRVWANKTTLDHFRRHLTGGQDNGFGKGKKKPVHTKAFLDAFERVVATRRTNKRFWLNAPPDDTERWFPGQEEDQARAPSPPAPSDDLLTARVRDGCGQRDCHADAAI